MVNDREAPLRDAISMAGITLSGIGWIGRRASRAISEEAEMMRTAVRCDDLEDLRAKLEHNQMQLPCTVALRSAKARADSPIFADNDKSVLALISNCVECMDPSQTGFYTTVRQRGQPQLISAPSWSVTDGNVSVSVDKRVRLSAMSPPWSASQTDRHDLSEPWQSSLMRAVMSAFLKQHTPIATIVRRDMLKQDETLGLVGVLAPERTSASLEPLKTTNGRISKNGDRLVAFTPHRTVAGGKQLRRGPTLLARDIDELQTSIGFVRVVSTVSAWWFTGCGAWLIAQKGWLFGKRIQALRRSKQQERQERIRRAEAAAANGDENGDSNGDGIAAETECMICMSRKRNAAFPCGHVVACFPCAVRCKNCPVCRRRGDAMELFLS